MTLATWNLTVLMLIGLLMPSLSKTAAAQAAPPPAVTLSAASGPQYGDRTILLYWHAQSGVASYRLYRGSIPGGEGANPLAEVSAGSGLQRYSDANLANGATFYYQVTAVNSAGESARSNEASATATLEPSLTLSGLRAQMTGSGAYSVDVDLVNSGEKTASGASLSRISLFYQVPTQINSQPSSVIETLTPDAPSFPDTLGDIAPGASQHVTATFSGVPPGGQFQTFNVSAAFGADGQTGGTLLQAPFPAPVAPSDLAAYATGSGKVTLYWSGVANATGYNVYRGTASGGEDYAHPVNGATPVASFDTGPGVANLFQFSDTGLTDGTEYYYTVEAVNGAAQSGPSNEDSDVPDPNAVPWDGSNPVSIVSAVNAIATAALPADPEDPDSDPATVGPLFILSPDGVVYQGNFYDGSSPLATQAPGYYDPSTDERVFSDGTVMVAPRDLGVTVQNSTSSPASMSAASATVADQGFGGLPPTGMTRQVATQPGATSFSGVVGLPNAADSSQVRLDAYHTGYTSPKTGKELVYPDGAEIYTGGHVSYPASVVSANPKTLGNDPGNIDAGVQLTTYPYPNTMWQPFIMPGIQSGTTQKLLLGGVGGKAVVGDWKTFISGEIRMVFETPMITQVPSKAVLMSYQTPYYSNGTTIRVRHVSAVDANNIPSYDKTLTPSGVTYYYAGAAARLWLKRAYNPQNPALGNNSFILKRTNVISQTLNPNSAPATHLLAPVANGPNNDSSSGFRVGSSYVLGAYWGDSDPYGVGLTGLPSDPWTDDSTVTGIAGSFPGTPSGLDRRYIKSTLNNPFFWETNLNMRTFLGTLVGF